MQDIDIPTRDLFVRVQSSHWTSSFFLVRRYFDCLVDAGAYVGNEAMYFKMMNPDGKVVSLEPCEESFNATLRNLAGMSVDVVMAAIGDGMPGRMNKGHPNLRNTFIPGRGTCPSMRLSEVVEKHGLHGRMMVKMNCEGGEAAVFDHEPSLSVLDACDMLLMECHGDAMRKRFLDLARSRFAVTHKTCCLGDRQQQTFRMMSLRLSKVALDDGLEPIPMDGG